MKKTLKKRAAPRKRKKKPAFSNGIQAFLLAGLIAVFALCLSLMIISIRSTLNKKPQVVNIEQIVDAGRNDDNSELRINNQITVDDVSPPAAIPQTKSQRPPETQSKPLRRQPSAERNTTPSHPTAVDAPAKNTPAVTNTVTSKPAENKEITGVVSLGTLVFVIDDAGNNIRELEPFLNIPGHLTIAVLPGLPNSAEAARRIRAAGKEVILHQPMEAIGGQDPGPGAIFSGMSSEEIKSVMARNIAEVGPVAGINNHQGSKITMDSDMMQTILTFCRENNLYFLDSKTTADTVAPAVARKVGIKFAERNVFIDNEQNKDAMLRYITNGLTRAQRNGLSVMIGHTWSPDLAPLLKEQYPLLIEQGYTIKKAFDIIK